MRSQSRFRNSDFQVRYLNLVNKNSIDNQSFCSLVLDDDTKQTSQQPFISRQSFKNIFDPLKRKNSLSETEGLEEQALRINQQRLRHTLSPRHQSTERMKNSLKYYFNSRLSQERQSKQRNKPIEQTLDNLQIKIQSMKEFMLKKNPREQKLDVQINKSKEKSEIFLKKVNRLSIASNFAKPNDYPLGKGSEKNGYYVSELVRKRNHKNSRQLEHLSQTLRIFKYLDDLEFYQSFKKRPGKLNLKKHPWHEGKKTIVFDLDETLIHCTETIGSQCDVVLTVKSKDQGPSEARINIRPYTLTFLKRLAEEFELMIFTASESCYADVVLDYLDPENKLFQHRLYRQHCCSYQDGYIKDLRIINRELSDLVIVDNSAYSYCLQLGNAIPILPYYQGSDDSEFKSLEKYLNKLKHVKDVREVNQRTFRFHDYLLFNSEVEIIDKVYSESD